MVPEAVALMTVKEGDVFQSTSNELAVELPVLVIFAYTTVVVVDSVVGVTDKLIVFEPLALAGRANAASHDTNPTSSAR